MSSKAIRTIPAHLEVYTTTQDPSLYTAIDHAGWRFIMKIASNYFSKTAHPVYFEGLKATGISLERVPLVSEMDAALQKFGWRAATVSGFIPPAAFLEFMENGILPIACEMRKVDNLNYTPAPDIVHEAAGHAPILADQEYADYVKTYGSVATKAIYSHKDLALYEAILQLSNVKEKPSSTPEQIALAQKNFELAYGDLDYVSEATHLARMSWWTIEYGLVGDLNQPMIYGAGLLSSLGESFHCLSDKVKKIPLSADCIHMAYDITKHQPQLFVASGIVNMREVLSNYANTMAYKIGGIEALGKAKLAATTVTTVLDTGLQVTGILNNFSCDQEGNPSFLDIRGPLQFCVKDQEIKEGSPSALPQRALAPVGTPKNFNVKGKEALNWGHFSFQDFIGDPLQAEWSSGIRVSGVIEKVFAHERKNLCLLLSDFTFSSPYQEESIKLESSFVFLGQKVPSVFGGAADRAAYLQSTEKQKYNSNVHQRNYDVETYGDLIQAYQTLRDMRDANRVSEEAVKQILSLLDTQYPNDWLLRWELLELKQRLNLQTAWASPLEAQLEALKTKTPQNKELIERALKFLESQKKN